MKKELTVSELARLSGVSVRTMHHYDEIGLLKPARRSETGYRYYGRDQLLRLQQILLYREMELPLAQILEVLEDPSFDTLEALRGHREELANKKERLDQLIKTVDKTITQLKNKSTMKFDEMYKGFSREQAEAYRKEASERWGEDQVAESENRILKMGTEKFEVLKKEGDRIYRELSALIPADPAATEVQKLVEAHYRMTGQFFAVTPEIYLNLGEMYVEDPRFKATFDKYHVGLADLLKKAIKIYAEAR